MKSRIKTFPKHTAQSFGYALSLAFYKLSFYGWRSILFVFIYDQFQESEAMEVATFAIAIAAGVSVAYLIGGVVGDLWLGNKRTAILGTILMFLGTFYIFLKPSLPPYLAIGLFVLGSGLYQPNLKALFAKLYLHDIRLLDAGFLLLNVFVSLGMFFGAFLVAIAAKYYGTQYGFLAVSISVFLSLLMLLLFRKHKALPEPEPQTNKSLFNKRAVKSTGVILAILAFYTFATRLSYNTVSDEYWNVDFDFLFVLNHYLLDLITYVFYLLIGIVLIIIWSRKYYSHWRKLTSATLLVSISFLLAFAFHTSDAVSVKVVTLISVLLYVVSDLFLEPIIQSSVAKLMNRKYLAIGFGSISLVTFIIGYLFLFLEEMIQLITRDTFLIGMAWFVLLALFLIARSRKNNRILKGKRPIE